MKKRFIIPIFFISSCLHAQLVSGGSGSGGGSAGSYSVPSATYAIATGTYFLPPGGGQPANTTEASVQGVVPVAGSIANFTVHLSAAAGTSVLAFTWRKGGSDQALTCSITGSGPGTSCSDLTHNFTVAAADLIDVKLVVSGADYTGSITMLWTPPVGPAGPTGAAGANGVASSISVNGSNITTQSAPNFQDSAALQGLTFTFSNPSAGNIKGNLGGTFPMLCQPGLGDGLNAIAAGTYLESACFNLYSGTYTITGVRCYTDNNGTSTLNITNGAGTALLTGAITCTNSFPGATGTQSGTTTIAVSDGIKFTFVSDGASKQTSWNITGTR